MTSPRWQHRSFPTSIPHHKTSTETWERNEVLKLYSLKGDMLKAQYK